MQSTLRMQRIAREAASRLRSARRALLAFVAAASALYACAAYADVETDVYLLRGWFGIFSTGMDTMAEELRSRGINAEAIGHLAWREAAAKIIAERAAGKTSRIVLVGHSQGANNIIDMARELQAHNVVVDLLITLAPYMQDPVPANVARALNFYQAGGWGTPLTADPGFKGELANIDMGSEVGIFHINIDKSTKVQAEVIAAIVAPPP